MAEDTETVLRRFLGCFNTRDYDGLMAEMTKDTIFEHVAQEGTGLGRHQGQAAVRAFWMSLEGTFPNFEFDMYDIVGMGDRGFCQWSCTFDTPDGPGFMKGADIFLMRDGKIAEKYTYTT